MHRITDLFLIRPDELRRTLFFIALFLVMGAGLAIGKGSADALFIKRFGVENFPYAYMALSVILALTCIVYAAYVDRLSSEKFFRIIFAIQLLALLITAVVVRLYDNDLIYPVYYLVYAISSEMLLVHGAVYIGQNFHTRQAKRLTPLILAGFQIGMMLGGGVLMLAVPLVGLGNAPLLWGGAILLAAFLLQLRHRRTSSPYYYRTARASQSRLAAAVSEVREGIEFTGKSGLLRNASYALFFMVITYYMMSYSVHTIYKDVFEDETALASFFGMLVIATNGTALVIQLFITNRLIDKIGVRKSNYIYPLTTVFSFLLLLLHPGFYAALFVSFNRETIMPAIRTPTRQMFFNVLPDNMLGRARAISVAIVMPLALFVCGVLIIVLKELDGLEQVALAGLLCALAYAWFVVLMGRNYIKAIISSMKEKLYLPEKDNLNYKDAGTELISAMKQGLASDNADVSLSYAKAIVVVYPDEAVSIILDRIRTLDVKTADQMVRMIDYTRARDHMRELDDIAASGDRHLQATIFDLQLSVDERQRTEKIEAALFSDNPRLQVSAIYAAWLYAGASVRYEALNAWRRLLDGDDADRLAALKLLPLLYENDIPAGEQLLASYTTILPGLLTGDDRQRSLAVMDALQTVNAMLPPAVADAIRPYLDDDTPSLRAAATGLLRQITTGDELEAGLWRALADGHEQVRQAALCVIMNNNPNYVYQIYDWLLTHNRGLPRAQLTLLREVIEVDPVDAMLQQLASKQLQYAATLLQAAGLLEADDSRPAELLRLAMLERLEQVNELILVSLEPLLGQSSIAVIRAGLKSRDERHIANALEALESMDNDKLDMIAGLVKSESSRLRKQGYGDSFETVEQVCHWCATLDDWWLRACAGNLMNNHEQQAHA